MWFSSCPLSISSIRRKWQQKKKQQLHIYRIVTGNHDLQPPLWFNESMHLTEIVLQDYGILQRLVLCSSVVMGLQANLCVWLQTSVVRGQGRVTHCPGIQFDHRTTRQTQERTDRSSQNPLASVCLVRNTNTNQEDIGPSVERYNPIPFFICLAKYRL